MARNVIIKRKTSSGYDEILPKTSIGQVQDLQDALDIRIKEEQIAGNESSIVYNKVAPVDGTDKVPIEFLPETAITGMEMTGVIVNATDAEDFINNTVGVVEKSGNYEIISSTVSDSLTLDVSSSIQPSEPVLFKNPQDGPAYKESIDVQSGDWLVYTGYEFEDTEGDYGTTGDIYYIYAVIDNNQSDRYLNKAGGTMSGNITMDGNNLKSVGYIGLSGTTNRLEYDQDELRWGSNKVFHTGNGGAGSDFDADLLDGEHGSFYRNASNINAGTIDNIHLPDTMNADTLDGEHGSFYRNASNIDSGTLNENRLPKTYVDQSNPEIAGSLDATNHDINNVGTVDSYKYEIENPDNYINLVERNGDDWLNIESRFGIVLKREGVNIMTLGSGEVGIERELNMNSNSITDVASPQNGSDAANKDYVDNGLNDKNSTYLADTANQDAITGDIWFDEGNTIS